MAKKSVLDEAKENLVEKQSTSDLSIEELKKKLSELEDLVASSDEEKLKRVCRAMKVDYQDIVTKETTPVATMVEMDMGVHQVTINGTVYRGKTTVNVETARVLQQAIGDRRMRLLKEMIGKDYMIEMLQDGTSNVRIVGEVNQYGEKVG